MYDVANFTWCAHAHNIQCNLSYLGSLGPRGARNCESARKYESSSTYVDFETFYTLNIPFLYFP